MAENTEQELITFEECQIYFDSKEAMIEIDKIQIWIRKMNWYFVSSNKKLGTWYK